MKEAFDLNFPLVPSAADGPTLPEGTSKDECFNWINSLASHTPPTWIGLDSDAEKELEIRKAKEIQEKIIKVDAKEDHDD